MEELRVLSLNLKAYDSDHSQKERLQRVADFCNYNLIDVVLLQEGTYGLFGGNSIMQLREMLNSKPSCYKESCFGYWMFYEFQLGILLNPIRLSTHSLNCKVKASELVDRIWLPGSRRVISTGSFISGLGIVEFVNCHLTSSPKTEEEREKQLNCLASYVFDKELAADVIIVGGDFNCSLPKICEYLSLDSGYKNLVWNGTDGIFAKGIDKYESKIVFSDHYVSDHCGVLTTIKY